MFHWENKSRRDYMINIFKYLRDFHVEDGARLFSVAPWIWSDVINNKKYHKRESHVKQMTITIYCKIEVFTN